MKQDYKNDDTYLARWLNNELSDAELADFKKSEEYALYQKIADKSTEFTIPSFNQEKVLEQIQSKLKDRKTKVRKFIPTWVYATAAAVLVLVGLTFFFNQETSFTSSVGQQLAYVLPDGSEVQLNGNSSVSFNKKQWDKGNRTLDLEGEGYFKVKKGSTFSVATEEGTVTVLGTQFNVQTVDNYLAVECYEGKVNVKNNKFEFILTPGKGVQFLKNQKKSYNISVSEPNWLLHNYQYNGVPLRVVFKDLENVYKVRIINKDVDLVQKYSGVLVKNNLDKALKVICKSMNITYTTKDKVVTISQ
ncbi:FecR family protein [Wenyingzhuangia aestuarii]|uniref:FecR family protein n=1 Tax=Wenyingzhuangia aestuarii TaxID=1647582 RepID=UPI00143A83DA|nr:FecR family protein [Wenyingzhuangia aestuarii]NJB81248.1 ferric-dicitrate binding protein FerR (iron transport regulator) [Wenyingzhuangia aestuarii]